jgi:hypothetical protein
MSKAGAKVENQERVAVESPGIAARCGEIQNILADGPATWERLREGLSAAFPAVSFFPLGEDLATLQVGGWVEAVPGEPGTFRLAQGSSGNPGGEAE